MPYPPFAIAFVLLAGLATAEPPCPSGHNPAVARLEAVVAAARADDFGRIMRELRQGWAPGPERRDALDEAIVNTGQWSVLSAGLAAERICVDGPTRAVGFHRNDLTGAVDRIRITVADSGSDGIVELAVANAVRLQDRPAPSPSRARRIAELDSAVAALARRGAFSGVVLLAHRGRPLYTRSFGVSNERLRIPITDSSQFNLASLNKIVTATAVLRLIERGQLSLDDSLGALLPAEFADSAAGGVRVKHLLSHTSGFGTYGPTRVFTPPGSAFAYSNYGFHLLGQIIEARTGLRFEDFLRLEILGPLQMARTARYEIKALSDLVPQGRYYPIPAPDDRLALIPNKYLHIYAGGAMGGMFSTAQDLLRFANALEAGRLVSPRTLELMRTPKPELGAPDYGFGVMRWKAPGVWGHSGRLPGADADLEFYEGGYTAIVLANLDHVNEPILLLLRRLFHESRPRSAT